MSDTKYTKAIGRSKNGLGRNIGSSKYKNILIDKYQTTALTEI
jgi:hypothetical protein